MKQLLTILLTTLLFTTSYSQTKTIKLKAGSYKVNKITVFPDAEKDASQDYDVEGKTIIYDSSGKRYFKEINKKTGKTFVLRIVKYIDSQSVVDNTTIVRYSVVDPADPKSIGTFGVWYDSSGKLLAFAIRDKSLIVIYIYYDSYL